MYHFLYENFGKKVISGVMTDRVMEHDGLNTPFTVETQIEMAYIKDASGKLPALIGLDFFHGTGLKSDDMWFMGYNDATLALAENMFNRGGFPIYCWHWKDPNQVTEENAFYTEHTNFDLSKAFSDPGVYETFDLNSAEYQNIIKDIDIVSGYLKTLADKNIPILWRPLHEAAGGWFWWGAKGAKPCRALWRLMFDRMVNHHKLDNLIWVWTCQEGVDALEWYPGDEYVDIIGRDFYYYPVEKNHNSLISSFENLKDLYGGRKIIALSENGSIPYPDNMREDGAWWSFFMPWNGKFTMELWEDHNFKTDWDRIMNHEIVITLDDMPGWDNYEIGDNVSISRSIAQKAARPQFSAHSRRGVLELSIRGADVRTVELFNLRGVKIATLSESRLGEGTHRFSVKGVARQMCFVRVTSADRKVVTLPVRIE
jgi:mannan endo-1,4-beta-mannosidase